jgi:hypothetical protein
MRSSWVDESWGKTEQLFMSAKRALLEAVRKQPMDPSARPPTTFAMWLLWSFISTIAACVALVGVDLANEASQPVARIAFMWAAAATAALAVILPVIGLLFAWIRRHRRVSTAAEN